MGIKPNSNLNSSETNLQEGGKKPQQKFKKCNRRFSWRWSFWPFPPRNRSTVRLSKRRVPTSIADQMANAWTGWEWTITVVQSSPAWTNARHTWSDVLPAWEWLKLARTRMDVLKRNAWRVLNWCVLPAACQLGRGSTHSAVRGSPASALVLLTPFCVPIEWRKRKLAKTNVDARRKNASPSKFEKSAWIKGLQLKWKANHIPTCWMWRLDNTTDSQWS